MRIPRDGRRDAVESRVSEYWEWIAVALFLLVTVDLLTSAFAAAEYGLAAETNPLMRWLLVQSTPVLVAANLAVTVAVVAMFFALMEMLKRTPTPYQRGFALAVELWLGVLVAVGLGVFANNLAVIVLGESLL